MSTGRLIKKLRLLNVCQQMKTSKIQKDLPVIYLLYTQPPDHDSDMQPAWQRAERYTRGARKGTTSYTIIYKL